MESAEGKGKDKGNIGGEGQRVGVGTKKRRKGTVRESGGGG